jgi:ORF6N domain
LRRFKNDFIFNFLFGKLENMKSQLVISSLNPRMRKTTPSQIEDIGSKIQTIRGERILLDADLAKIYGVSTKVFNQAVRRNLKRFPDDFMFRLTSREFQSLRSQIVTSKLRGGRRYIPYAFTENGAIMAANVLNSPQAVRMSVFVVRAFVQMRELLGGTKELAKQLAALEKKLTERLDGHEIAIIEILQRVMDILDPPPPPPDPPRPQIGFHIDPEEKPESKAKKKS